MDLPISREIGSISPSYALPVVDLEPLEEYRDDPGALSSVEFLSLCMVGYLVVRKLWNILNSKAIIEFMRNVFFLMTKEQR